MFRKTKYFKIILTILCLAGVAYIALFAYNSMVIISLSKEYTVSQKVYGEEIKDTLIKARGGEQLYGITSQFLYKYGEKVTKLKSNGQASYLIELPIKNMELVSWEQKTQPPYFTGRFLEPLNMRNATAYFPIRESKFIPSKELIIGYTGVLNKHSGKYLLDSTDYISISTEEENIFDLSFSNKTTLELTITRSKDGIAILMTPYTVPHPSLNS
ncbi:hypothetical protein [Sphingobacterium sp. SYP-B4668]|uniref:hypothetical protein n=1 Tax=Sphingobacterium sp. SYP-B4668 TaxID=2996035 RepID=UPI0022DE56BC|nr:hypothetical protein [Sphingobacterium sp. SYP-B4668]